MGNSSSESALLNEKKIHMNQVLWENQRLMELNRIFSKNFRNELKKEPLEYESHHKNFLKKIDKENEQKLKKYENESKIYKKILGDNRHFRLYINNFHQGNNEKDNKIDNMSLKGSFSPKIKLNKNMRKNMRILSQDFDQ